MRCLRFVEKHSPANAMKKSEIPQDPSPLDKFTKEILYALDENGNYTPQLSRGWKVKADALGISWSEVKARIESAKEKMLSGQASPILYFMELNLMDVSILSAYTGFWKWTIKRHLKPSVFRKLSSDKLKIYADVFGVSVEQLKKGEVGEN
jgi:DNA-binding Lrp family transcriptional regulator